MIETRLSPIAATTHSQLTVVNTSRTSRQSGPRHQSIVTAITSRITGIRNVARLRRGTFTSGRGPLVQLLEPACDVLPRVALLCEDAGGPAHGHAALLVGDHVGDRVGQRGFV